MEPCCLLDNHAQACHCAFHAMPCSAVWAVCTGAVPAPVWSPATHNFYPAKLQAAAPLSLLLILKARLRRQGLFSKFPPELLQRIVEPVLGDIAAWV